MLAEDSSSMTSCMDYIHGDFRYIAFVSKSIDRRITLNLAMSTDYSYNDTTLLCQQIIIIMLASCYHYKYDLLTWPNLMLLQQATYRYYI